MKKSSPLGLVLLALFGIGAGFLLEWLLARRGLAMLQLEAMFSIVLVLLGLALIGLAWPIRRMVRDKKAQRVSPFWAVRILLLAQASAYAAALMAGIAGGILIWAFTKLGLPLEVYLTNGFACLAGVALLIAALVAESFCRIPPSDDQESPTTNPTPTSPV